MFVDENHRQMREFMLMAETYSPFADFDHEVIQEQRAEPQSGILPIHVELIDLVQRLRMFTESSGGEYALGFEMGMQRAAEMLTNVLNESFGESQIG